MNIAVYMFTCSCLLNTCIDKVLASYPLRVNVTYSYECSCRQLESLSSYLHFVSTAAAQLFTGYRVASVYVWMCVEEINASTKEPIALVLTYTTVFNNLALRLS